MHFRSDNHRFEKTVVAAAATNRAATRDLSGFNEESAILNIIRPQPKITINISTVWLLNRLISARLKSVLSHTEN